VLLAATALLPAQTTSNPSAVARKALDLLLAQRYPELSEMFSETLKKSVTLDFLQDRVNAELKAILAEPAVIERLRELGSDTRPTTPEGFKERVADDVAKWTKVVADAKIPKV